MVMFMFVPYIIGAVLLGVFIIVVMIIKKKKFESIKKILSAEKYDWSQCDADRKQTETMAYRIKDVLTTYGAKTNSRGFLLECVVIKTPDKRLKLGEIGFEIIVKAQEGDPNGNLTPRVIGKPYFRKFKQATGKNAKPKLIFDTCRLKDFPEHFAKILQEYRLRNKRK
jgi:hypothetical protein